MNQVTNSTEDGYAEFEVHCNGDYEASAFGPRERAWAEIQHYAAQYRQDGPVVIYEVTRRIVNPETDSCEMRLVPTSPEWLRLHQPAVYAAWVAGTLTPAQVDWMAGWDACRRAGAQNFTEEQWVTLAQTHVGQDWNCEEPDGYLRAVKAVVCDAFELAAAGKAVTDSCEVTEAKRQEGEKNV
jgi:hypothetical protein